MAPHNRSLYMSFRSRAAKLSFCLLSAPFENRPAVGLLFAGWFSNQRVLPTAAAITEASTETDYAVEIRYGLVSGYGGPRGQITF